jgi:hypothetical protein
VNPLLIRPKNYKDEGLRGFISRAAHENGYNNSKMVFEYADIIRGHKSVNLLVSKETININKLSSILTIEKSVLEEMVRFGQYCSR